MPPQPSIWQRIRQAVSWPGRMWREHISIQMIGSYLSMVLLVLILFEATVLVSILINPGDRFFAGRQVTIDPYLGERASAYVQWIDPDRIDDILNETPLNRRDVEAVNGQLRQIANGTVPGFQGVSPLESTDQPLVLIVDAQGRVIFSSDPTITAFTPVDQLPDRRADAVVRNQSLRGEPDDRWSALYSLELNDDRTVATYPVINSDGEWVGTFVLESGSVSHALGQTRGEFFRQISVVFLQSLWIFAIPAVIVAIPFGIWRASTISRRLQRLANATERMAAGELNTRVRVRRNDEIGRLGESFNTLAEQLHLQDKARRAFLSNVSHELRTPVSIIMGNAELMQTLPAAQSDEVATQLSIIQHEGQMLVRLIDDLFTSARLQEANLALHKAPLILADVVNEVVGGVQHIAWKDRKVSVESMVSADLPRVSADAQRLQQIVSNLIYNALRHTPEGGLVVVMAEEQDEMMRISITDTGLGMDEETLANVFTRYYQAERNRRHGEGSGLGLHVVHMLVEAHGGTIRVESTPGQGTTFICTLPLAD